MLRLLVDAFMIFIVCFAVYKQEKLIKLEFYIGAFFKAVYYTIKEKISQ